MRMREAMSLRAPDGLFVQSRKGTALRAAADGD
jgi:hypothetical protein